MLVYGAILPHAVSLHSLISGQFQGLPPTIQQAFDQIASDMHGRGVRTIVSIGTHPHYRRAGFSAYVSPQYRLSFKDLGDLIHEDQIAIAWDAFHALREASLATAPVLHPIDDADLDLSHALPLWLIHNRLPAEEKRTFLCINDSNTATPQERAAMAEEIAKMLNSLSTPAALIVSQELFIADAPQQGALDAMKASNVAARYQASGYWTKEQASMQTIVPCLSGPLALAHASFRMPKPWAYEECCFEHVGQTSLLAARLLPPPEL